MSETKGVAQLTSDRRADPVGPDADAREAEYLTARQLAGKVNVSLKAVTKWTQARRLPACKMGRVWRYPAREIEKRLLSGSLLYDKRQ
jgi:excisionase family DNA binding protein